MRFLSQWRRLSNPPSEAASPAVRENSSQDNDDDDDNNSIIPVEVIPHQSADESQCDEDHQLLDAVPAGQTASSTSQTGPTLPLSVFPPSDAPDIKLRPGTILLLLLCLYTVAFLMAHDGRVGLPEACPINETGNMFSGHGAWKHLQQLTQRPHPHNSFENDRVRMYLADQLQQLCMLAKQLGRQAECLSGEDDVYLTDNYYSDQRGIGVGKFDEKYTGIFYHDHNLLLHLPGTETNASILFSAHYDSVETSPGVTDNGIAVATLLEVIRALLYQPPTRHGILFLFNNGEELGLFGSQVFLQHPWAKNVRTFVNIDGAGAGGKPIVFQATDAQVLAPWANSRQTHANVIGNDMFSMGLIASDTDFSIYAKHWPGIDVAFYERRGWYHTRMDNIENASEESAQFLGENLLTYARHAANAEQLPARPTPSDGSALPRKFSVYYDIFGMHLVVLDYISYQIINVVLLCIALMMLTTVSIRVARQTQLSLRLISKQLFSTALQFSGQMVIALVGSLIPTSLIVQLNPIAVYRRPYWFYLLYALLFAYTLDRMQKYWPIRTSDTQLRLTAMSLLWTLGLILSMISAALFNLGSLYFTLWYVGGCLIALAWGELSAWELLSNGWLMRTLLRIGRLMMAAILPSMFMMSLADAITAALAPTIADGNAALPLCIIIGCLAALSISPVLPFMPQRDARKTSNPIYNTYLQLAAILSLVLSFISGYSVETPIKVIAWQAENAEHYLDSSASANLTILAPRDLDLVLTYLPNISSVQPYCTRSDITHINSMSCTWPAQAPVFKQSPLSVRLVDDSTAVVYAPESRYCTLYLSEKRPVAVLRNLIEAVPSNSSLDHESVDWSSWFDEHLDPVISALSDISTSDSNHAGKLFEALANRLTNPSLEGWLVSDVALEQAQVMRKNIGQPWAFRIVGAHGHGTVRVRCHYHDIARHTPALEHLFNEAPDWIRMTSSDMSPLYVDQVISLGQN